MKYKNSWSTLSGGEPPPPSPLPVFCPWGPTKPPRLATWPPGTPMSLNDGGLPLPQQNDHCFTLILTQIALYTHNSKILTLTPYVNDKNGTPLNTNNKATYKQIYITVIRKWLFPLKYYNYQKSKSSTASLRSKQTDDTLRAATIKCFY